MVHSPSRLERLFQIVLRRQQDKVGKREKGNIYLGETVVLPSSTSFTCSQAPSMFSFHMLTLLSPLLTASSVPQSDQLRRQTTSGNRSFLSGRDVHCDPLCDCVQSNTDLSYWPCLEPYDPVFPIKKMGKSELLESKRRYNCPACRYSAPTRRHAPNRYGRSALRGDQPSTAHLVHIWCTRSVR